MRLLLRSIQALSKPCAVVFVSVTVIRDTHKVLIMLGHAALVPMVFSGHALHGAATVVSDMCPSWTFCYSSMVFKTNQWSIEHQWWQATGTGRMDHDTSPSYFWVYA